jgi:hypothetical protein
MDFEEHYQNAEAKAKADMERTRREKEDRDTATAIDSYNKAMRAADLLIPELLSMYGSNPPTKHGWLVVGGKRFVSWQITKCKDDEHVYNTHLLSDGRIAVTHTAGTWHDAYEPAINEHGAEIQKWVWSGWHMSEHSDFIEILPVHTITKFEGKQRAYADAVCATPEGIRNLLAEPDRLEAERTRKLEHAAAKAALETRKKEEQAERARQQNLREKKESEERMALANTEKRRDHIEKIESTALTFPELIFYNIAYGLGAALCFGGGVTLVLAVLVTLAQSTFVDATPLKYLLDLTPEQRITGLRFILLSLGIFGVPAFGVAILSPVTIRREVSRSMWRDKWTRQTRRR